MNALQSAVLQMRNARFALDKIAALLGFLAILSTVSCAPSKSKSPSTSPAPIGVEATKKADSQNEGSVADSTADEKNEATEPEPKIETETETKAKPTSEIQSETAHSTLAGGGGAGDAGGGNNDRPTSAEIRDAINALVSNTAWVEHPIYNEVYKDPQGKTHLHLTVAPENEQLGAMLVKIRNYLVERNITRDGLRVEIKESGACQSVDGNREGSAKICDLKTPICLSIEQIQQLTPKASLERSLKSLIMHEYAHQNCADEAMAKQVEHYYDRPVVQNIFQNLSVKNHFDLLRKMLTFMRSGFATGMTPYKGKFARKFEKKEICESIPQAVIEAQALQDMTTLSGFVRDDIVVQDVILVPENLVQTLGNLYSFCGSAPEPRAHYIQKTEKAIQLYDKLAQEFSKNSGITILDFSLHLFKEGGPLWGGSGEFDQP